MKEEDLILNSVNDITFENYSKVTKKFVDINPGDVQHELLNQASLYAYYAGLKADCKRLLDIAVLDLETYCSTERQKKKEANPFDKLTEKTLDSYVQTLPDFKLLNKTVIDLEYKVSLMKGLENALNQRKDILVQLSANARKEMGLY